MSGKTLAAAAAGMSERTAGCWQHGGLPSTAKAPRSWGTREDAFAAVWQAEVVPQLVADTDGRPQVLTLFKALCRRHPGRFQGLGAAVRIEDFEDFGTTTNGLSLPRVSRNRTMLAKSEIQKEALDLPAQERIELVVELWDSPAPGQISVPDWQRDLIRDRLAALEDLLPEERSVPWGAVRKRIFSDKT